MVVMGFDNLLHPQHYDHMVVMGFDNLQCHDHMMVMEFDAP